MKQILMIIMAFSFGFGAELKIAAPGNLRYVLEDIQVAYANINPLDTLDIKIKSNGELTNEIRKGKHYDLFLSSNIRNPAALYYEGLAITKPKVYAKGYLLLFSVKDFDLSKGLEILKNPDIKTISIADPDNSVYGEAAFEALQNADIYEEVKDKLVVSKTIAKSLDVSLKSADIGFVAASLIYNPRIKRHFKLNKEYAVVDKKFYTTIRQSMIILKTTKDLEASKKFYNFILSPVAKKIFRKYGYDF